MGPCAKKTVVCVIVSEDGTMFIGMNNCETPQSTCPRLPGEGYEKCRTICNQPGHAEIMALNKAGSEAKGARAYVRGISYVCRECQEALFAAGVRSLHVRE